MSDGGRSSLLRQGFGGPLVARLRRAEWGRVAGIDPNSLLVRRIFDTWVSVPLLRYQGPDGKITFVDLGTHAVSIGRGSDCDLTLQDTQSSRKHCEVRQLSGGSHVVVDLQSKNGTQVNGSPVSTWTLKDGDLITVGNSSIIYKLQK